MKNIMRKFMKKIIYFLLILILPTATAVAVTGSTSPYGVNIHHADNTVLQKVRTAGIKWVRSDVLWSGVEYQKGSYDWSQVDRVIDYAYSNGLSMLFTISYTPGWANNNKGIIYPPDNVNDWINFVTLTINRYKSKVKHWSIWNEPNASAFFGETKDVFVQKIFLPAAAAIRSADPSAFIVGPETAHLVGTNAEWYFWMKYILTECGQYIDIVSHHIYKSEGAYYIYELLETGETFVPSVKEIIEKAGHGNKPFWITETGWNTRAFSENVQADRYLDMLTKRKEKNYPQKIFFYEIIDDPNPNIDPWGILRYDLSEKPAYTVYKDFIAGKYDDIDNGGSDDGNNNKCYSKDVGDGIGNNKGKILISLRNFRDNLRRSTPEAEVLITNYYRFSGELTDLSFKDSRLFKLGVELLNLSNNFLLQHGQSYQSQKLSPTIVAKLQQMAALLKEKPLSPGLRNFILWGENQLHYLRKDSIGNYLSHQLKKNSLSIRHRHLNQQ
jgi:polysaccharide biosynthesis protein PslG